MNVPTDWGKETKREIGDAECDLSILQIAQAAAGIASKPKRRSVASTAGCSNAARDSVPVPNAQL
eukprot:2216758-Amphidinium_carterae.1